MSVRSSCIFRAKFFQIACARALRGVVAEPSERSGISKMVALAAYER
ncbi:MAG: hypothetical protein O2779_03215 [Nanoarchaeota archaeon]|nr:hypothetical protein [Nanoarchaeota archaeon]